MTYELETEKSYLEKIKTWEEIGSISSYINSGWQEKNKSIFLGGSYYLPPIVLVVDTFDIVHAGVVRFLSGAKHVSPGVHRTLIVGVYSDKATKIRDGLSKPFVSEQSRAEALAGLSCVDYVTIIDQTHPLLLIRMVKPKEFVVGSVRTGPVPPANAIDLGPQVIDSGSIAEVQELNKYGGKYLLVILDNPTTSQIVHNIEMAKTLSAISKNKDRRLPPNIEFVEKVLQKVALGELTVPVALSVILRELCIKEQGV